MLATWSDCRFANGQDYTAVASSAVEASLLSGGGNLQPVFFKNYFEGANATSKAFRLIAQGILATTGTPTIIFQVRLGSTQGPTSLGGSSLGVTAAITTGSGVTNQFWRLELDVICKTPGMGTGNCTLTCAGTVKSPGGFASPYEYALEPTTPPTGTWTATIDGNLDQYLNLSVTWGTSSSSNTITLKQLLVLGLN